MCLGSLKCSQRRACNWTELYSWRAALALSVTLGGFGADRFYLGHLQVLYIIFCIVQIYYLNTPCVIILLIYKEGIGKQFIFGGLGVRTVVNGALVAVVYIGPADGSLYI